MTILSVVRAAATKLGIKVPDMVYGSDEREMEEMRATVSEAAAAIAFDGHDWTALKALATIPGNGTEALSLPTDYKRMLKKTRVWSSSAPSIALIHYSDSDEWLAQTVQNLPVALGGWTLIGRQMHVRPALASVATVRFYYLSSALALGLGDVPQSDFETDNDKFILDERLLKLAIIWRWRASKGLPYAEDMTNYEAALESAVAADKGSNILASGTSRAWGDIRLAYPGSLG